MAVNINIPSQVSQTITDGVTDKAPSENAVNDALALKANTADLGATAFSNDYNDLDNLPTLPSGTVTSVGLTMPSAFSVANSPITSSGDIAVTGAGVASQYVRGDGSLANFPTTSGGGASVNYYLNGSVSQGTFGGSTYYEMSKTPIIGAGTNFTRTNAQGNGYIASFITDAGDPNLLNIPGGNWNLEFYFNSSSNGGSPSFYAELYKVDLSNAFTLIASGATNPEGITNGTTVDQYFTSIPVPQTTILATDRIAIRIFVITGGRTITLHTEDNNLSEIITTFSTGLNALNGLTAQVQYFGVGTSGTDFNINSATDTHTFNLPTASATNRGALSTSDWSAFNGKQATLVSGTNIKSINGTSLLGSGDITVGGGIAVGTTAVTSGTIGRVFFQGTGNVVQQDASFLFDGTNKTLTNYGKGAIATNTSFGLQVFENITTAFQNSAFGVRSLQKVTTSSYNSSFGYEALMNHSTGDSNTAFGWNALKGSTGGISNTAIGMNAGLSITTGFGNVVLGASSTTGITTGTFNTLIGCNITGLSTGLANSVILTDGNGISGTALWKNSSNFVGIGHNPTSGTLGAKLDVKAQGALSTDIAFRVRNSADSLNIISANGAGDVFVGLGAGRVNAGTQNTFIGTSAGYSNTTGNNNTFIGKGAGQNHITNADNTFIGVNSGFSNLYGTGGTFVGSSSGQANTANYNSFFGTLSGNANTSGTENSFFGSYTAALNTTGNNNSAFGATAAYSNTSGSNNSFFGQNSGRYIADGATANAIVNNSVFLGTATKALANNQTNQIVIGYNAIGAGSNTATLGNTSIVKTILRGTLNAANLPTSPAGLVTGDIWNNLGILTIV